MGNDSSKHQINDEEDVHSTIVATKVENSATIYKSENMFSSRKESTSGVNQIGSNNTANIGTYNEVGRDQNNSYHTINNPDLAPTIQEQAEIAAIRSLRIAGNPNGNQHRKCADNTRVPILRDIRNWVEDANNTAQLFWLADRAGTGKSTVAKQIAKEWEEAAKPVASFFFSINAADTRSNSTFCPSIAANLAKLRDFGSFRSMLTDALKQNPTMETCDFGGQFEELLCTPLKEIDKPVLIVIDALDECDKRDRSELLSVLLDKLNKLPMVKVLITSRPEPDIAQLLQPGEFVRSSDLRGTGDVDSSIRDVSQYITQFFAKSHALQSIQSSAPVLAKAANGLFIYAYTACQFLQNSLDPEEALKIINSISGLDGLYLRIMESAIPNDTVSLPAATSILQAILAAQRPLSVSEMQILLKKDKVVQSVVGRLASVLSSGSEDKPVEILHPTFQEYLTNKDRSGVYFIDMKQGHKALAIGCLETCSSKMAPYSNWILSSITSTLRYAGLYWLNHAAAFLREANAQADIQSLEDQIIALFKKDLIHWFELIVLLNAVAQCIKHLATLETSGTIGSAKISGSTSRIYECILWCQDAQRFLQHHQPGIEQGWIHVQGALAFTPKGSLIYKIHFNRFAQRIPAVLSGIPVEWPSHRILSGHTEGVSCMAFSPDGTRVVSGSHDNTLRLWDGVTGASIGGPMNGHTGVVYSVAFSPDGTRVVSGSWDHTLRLWDGVTGASIGGPMNGHNNVVISVAFSPDGTRVVSSSHDRTIRLWDLSSFVEVAIIDTASDLYDVEFSACGSYIISDGNVWDTRLLPPSLVNGANPAVFTRPSSPIGYNWRTRMIEVHTHPTLTFPVSGCQVQQWVAHGGRITLGLDDGRVMIIDCTHLM